MEFQAQAGAGSARCVRGRCRWLTAAVGVALGKNNPPTVSSINLASRSPTNASSVSWTVTFSAAVTGVSSSNFTLVKSGLSGTPTIGTVSGSGTTWTVAASTGAGSGTLQLNLTSDTGIKDGEQHAV